MANAAQRPERIDRFGEGTGGQQHELQQQPDHHDDGHAQTRQVLCRCPVSHDDNSNRREGAMPGLCQAWRLPGRQPGSTSRKATAALRAGWWSQAGSNR
jgi:hypothetical protein